MPKKERQLTVEELGLGNATELLLPTSQVDFERARVRVLSEEKLSSGIGTLSEKTMHKVVKSYIEPDVSYHEREYLGSVADIMRDGVINEIQTRAYDRLIPKLKRFLPSARVRVVCPLSAEKSVRWVDPETGALTEPRRSPKRESIYDAFFKLYQIRRQLADDNLSVRVMFFKSDEYRYLNGWDKSAKRGSSRMENIPSELLFDLVIESREQYKLFLPRELGETFTASELSRAIKRTGRYTFYVIKLLLEVGAIVKCEEKRGNAFLYKRGS